MTTVSTTLTEATENTPRQSSFLFELLGLIAKVFAAAIAINVVFAAIVLLFASQASADSSPVTTPQAPVAHQSTQPSPATTALR